MGAAHTTGSSIEPNDKDDTNWQAGDSENSCESRNRNDHECLLDTHDDKGSDIAVNDLATILTDTEAPSLMIETEQLPRSTDLLKKYRELYQEMRAQFIAQGLDRDPMSDPELARYLSRGGKGSE